MKENNYFAKNLKFLREKSAQTQEELADFLGRKSFTSVSDWERGKSTPDAGTLRKISRKFNLSIDELMESDLQNKKSTKSISTQQSLIPIVGGVHAGTPNYAVEDIEGYMTLPPNKQSADGLIYLRVQSDSMDKKFPVGSYVLIDTYATAENGDIAVVKMNGDEATLKKVKFDYENNQMFLIPDSNNENHMPQVVEINNGVSLVGKVIGMYMNI